MNVDSFLVWVYCITFNQAEFIVDTMEGFCRQKTSFPFVCTIVDDASLDGEQEVIMNFLHDYFIIEEDLDPIRNDTIDYTRFFARHRTNYNCFFDVLFLKYNHFSKNKTKLTYLRDLFKIKYRAVCEGDDYWIDSSKLQKEIDFLEKHDDCAMVYTAYSRLTQGTGEMQDIVNPKEYLIFNDNCKWAILTNEIMVGAATVVYRTALYSQIWRDYADDYYNAKMTDVQTWFHFARLSQIYYIPDITAVYRKHEGSATSINSVNRFGFLKNALDVHYMLATRYNAPDIIKDMILSRYGKSLLTTGIDYHLYDDCIAFVKQYMPRNRVLLMVLQIGRGLPFVSPSLVRRFALTFLPNK